MSSLVSSLPQINPHIEAKYWNDPDPGIRPHWDGIESQIDQWIKKQATFVPHTHPDDIALFGGDIKDLPSEIIIRIGDGQTPKDLDLPNQYEFEIECGDGTYAGGDLHMSVVQGDDGHTYIEAEVGL